MALVILGVSVYSLRESADMAEDLVALGNRASALHNIDKAILRRTLLTRELNQTTDEKAIAALIENDMAQNGAQLDEALASYEANIPADGDPSLREASGRLRILWNVFAAESNKVGEYATENSNNRAARLNDANTEFWDGVDADLEVLAKAFFEHEDSAVSGYADKVFDLRTDLMRFRLMLVKYVNERDPKMRAFYATATGDIMQRVDTLFAELAAELPPQEAGRARELFETKLAAHGKGLVKEILTLIDRDTNGLAMAHMVGPTRAARIEVENLTGDRLAVITRTQEQARDMTEAMERRTLIIMAVISAAGIVIMSLLSWRIISGLVSRLNGLIARLGASSDSVQGASGQVSDSSQSLAEGATEQAASLEETSSALEQMASMTRQNADNAGKTASTMSDTLKLVGEGSTTVGDVTTAMAAINESAEKIGNIIKTIEEIAFQTNLLALNAAVEAARAGEAGKGFAVVADEVRNLAQRSAQAAKDTSELIEGTVERVRTGSENVDNLAEGFRKIEDAAQEVGRLVTEISAATNEQAQGVDQVNTAVAQMDKVTQSNAASAEQSASAAEELSGQAESMKHMVDELVGLVEGRAGGAVIRVSPGSFHSDDDGFGNGGARNGNGRKNGKRAMLALTHDGF